MRTFTRARFSAFLIISTIIVFSQAALAHSEKEKARFVAEAGKDVGTCNNRFRPCETIRYAVQQANKGDKILVAEGRYAITNQEDLVYLVSELQPVLGGYNTLDNYQVQQPSQFKSVLVGVPPEYSEVLYNKGFHIIADTKSLDQSELQLGLQAIEQMQTAQPATPCIDGNAAGFACDSVSLLGRMPLNKLSPNSNSANDIWGHVDLNNMNEYAIIGLQRGISVVNVTNPENPTLVGTISGQPTTWRDIKVFQFYSTGEQRWKAYAYAGADSVTEGLTIIDLNSLPNEISLVTRSTVDRSAPQYLH